MCAEKVAPDWVPREQRRPGRWVGVLSKQGHTWSLHTKSAHAQSLTLSGDLPDDMVGSSAIVTGYLMHTAEGPRLVVQGVERVGHLRRHTFWDPSLNPTTRPIVPQYTQSPGPSLTDAQRSHLMAKTFLEIAQACGTDKVLGHDYAGPYQRHTQPLRASVRQVFEFGIAEGASTLTWSKWFYNAHIHGFDLHTRLPQGPRITHYALDCTTDKIAELAADLRPEVIIDDAAHTMRSHERSFDLTFPHLAPGGVYVIEDLETCYEPAFGGSPSHLGEVPLTPASTALQGHRGRTIDWLSELAHATMCARYSAAQRSKVLAKYPYFCDIASVHFYESLVFIFKRLRTLHA